MSTLIGKTQFLIDHTVAQLLQGQGVFVCCGPDRRNLIIDRINRKLLRSKTPFEPFQVNYTWNESGFEVKPMLLFLINHISCENGEHLFALGSNLHVGATCSVRRDELGAYYCSIHGREPECEHTRYARDRYETVIRPTTDIMREREAQLRLEKAMEEYNKARIALLRASGQPEDHEPKLLEAPRKINVE